jgi:hypothetical protein
MGPGMNFSGEGQRAKAKKINPGTEPGVDYGIN